jgi:hypothetical protein
MSLGGPHSSDVTVQPVPGQKVTITAHNGINNGHNDIDAVLFPPLTTHVILHGFTITGEVQMMAAVGQGVSFIRVDRNDITGGTEGVSILSQDCKVPNAPQWTNCASSRWAPITDVIISGNRIHNIVADDAININNWRRVRVTGNEIIAIIENGNHNDCLQSTFGGSDITFDRNYEHDNQCQGFFLKDGDVTNATVYDNLFVRDTVGGLSENNIQIFDTYNAVVRNNTNWSGNGDVLREPYGGSYTATVDHNVSPEFNNGCCNEPIFTVSEGWNLFGHAPWTTPFDQSTTDTVNANPQFVDPTHDDYRLASNPKGIGVDWSPATQHYGP